MAKDTSQLIADYILARDREQHAFEVSQIGEAVRDLLNRQIEVNGAVSHRVAYIAQAGLPRLEPVALSLAAMVAFEGSMPAFYAGRSLRLW